MQFGAERRIEPVRRQIVPGLPLDKIHHPDHAHGVVGIGKEWQFGPGEQCPQDQDDRSASASEQDQAPIGAAAVWGRAGQDAILKLEATSLAQNGLKWRSAPALRSIAPRRTPMAPRETVAADGALWIRCGSPEQPISARWHRQGPVLRWQLLQNPLFCKHLALRA